MSQGFAKLMRGLQQHMDWVRPGCAALPKAKIGDQDWMSFLSVHNGLAAFNGGLRIFGTESSLLPSLHEWNSFPAWRYEYQGLDEGLTFFAEDVFGNQFGFADGGAVVRFLAETGDRQACGPNSESWLEKILLDPEQELNLWLLESWRREASEPNLSEHLCPKMPFVAQGPATPSNLYTLDRTKSMRFQGNFAHQIRNMKTGDSLEIKVR